MRSGVRRGGTAVTVPLVLGKHQVQLECGEDNRKAFRHIKLDAHLHIYGKLHWIAPGSPVPVRGINPLYL